MASPDARDDALRRCGTLMLTLLPSFSSAHLVATGFHHASFSLRHESRLDDSPLSREAIVEPGQLIRFLQRGLIYSAVEAHVQEDGTEKPCSAPFRLVGPPHICDGKQRPPPPPASPVRLSPSPPPALAAPRFTHKEAATQTAAVSFSTATKKVLNGSHTSTSSSSRGLRRISDERDRSSKVASSSKKKLDDAHADDVEMTDTAEEPRTARAKDAKRKASASLAASAGEREDKRAKRDEGAASSVSERKRPPNGVQPSADDRNDKAEGSATPSASGRNGKAGSSRASSPGPTDKVTDGNGSAVASDRTGARAREKDAIRKKKAGKSGLENGSLRKGEGKKEGGKADKGSSAGSGKAANATVEQPEGDNYVTSDEITVLAGHTGEVFGSAWNPTVPGMLASGAGDATVRIWDLPQRPGDPVDPPTVCKHLPATQSKDISTLHWNPDGTLLASGSYDGILRLWTPQGDLHLVMSMHQGAVISVRWNRKGNMLLTGSADGTAIVWDLSSGKTRQQFPLHSDGVLDVEWLTTAEGSLSAEPGRAGLAVPTHGLSNSVADSIFATCSADNSINICRLGETRPIKSFKGHTDEVNAIRFDPSQTLLASVSDDCSAKIWALELAGSSNASSSVGGGSCGEGSRKRSVRGRGGSANMEGTDAEEDKEQQGHRGEGENGERERDKDRGTPCAATGGNPASASLSAAATSASASTGAATASGPSAATKDGASAGAPASFSSAGAGAGAATTTAAAATANVVTTTAKGPNKGLRLTLSGHTKEVYAVAWCPTGPGSRHPDQPRMVATTSFDWTARLWNADNGDCLRVIDSHEDNVYTLCFSPCARFLATGGIDKRVHITRVQDGALVKQYVGGGPIFGLSWKSVAETSASDAAAKGSKGKGATDAAASASAGSGASSSAGARQHKLAISQADRKLVVLWLRDLEKVEAKRFFSAPKAKAVPGSDAKAEAAAGDVVPKKEKRT
ncbi:hypothetical protein ACQY0O_007810 [Thecaphora frezii]